jgi:hypothetical protein
MHLRKLMSRFAALAAATALLFALGGVGATFSAPLLAGEVLMSRSGFENWLQQRFLPREQRIARLDNRVDALERHLAEWGRANLHRLHLWPGNPQAERFGPGVTFLGRDTLDVPPMLIDGRTMVPLRYIGSVLGAEVYWHGDTERIVYTAGDRQIVLTVGQTTALINGRAVETDVPPQIRDGRTMVPVRFVSQWLGAIVNWDENLNRVELLYRQ